MTINQAEQLSSVFLGGEWSEKICLSSQQNHYDTDQQDGICYEQKQWQGEGARAVLLSRWWLSNLLIKEDYSPHLWIPCNKQIPISGLVV